MAKSNADEIFEYRDLTEKELADYAEIYKGSSQLTNIRVGPKGYLLNKEFKDVASDIFNMPLRPNDVFVASYQRSGTTWTQELVWLLANDFNYETAMAVPLPNRYQFLEMSIFFTENSKQCMINMSSDLEKMKKIIEDQSTPATKILAEIPLGTPRFVKTHLPMSLLPPKLLDTVKVVYVARDPRDVIVSSFHHAKLFAAKNFNGHFKQVWDAFRKDLFKLTPYFEHVKEAWALRHHPNMLFLFYEDLSKDLQGSICRVATFLGKELKDQSQMERLCEHLSFENFKKNQSVNFEHLRDPGFINANETFIRKGKSGGWRDYFDEEMKSQADQWIEENLRDSDLRFPSMQPMQKLSRKSDVTRYEETKDTLILQTPKNDFYKQNIIST